jgi:hypothetical protein
MRRSSKFLSTVLLAGLLASGAVAETLSFKPVTVTYTVTPGAAALIARSGAHAFVRVEWSGDDDDYTQVGREEIPLAPGQRSVSVTTRALLPTWRRKIGKASLMLTTTVLFKGAKGQSVDVNCLGGTVGTGAVATISGRSLAATCKLPTE